MNKKSAALGLMSLASVAACDSSQDLLGTSADTLSPLTAAPTETGLALESAHDRLVVCLSQVVAVVGDDERDMSHSHGAPLICRTGAQSGVDGSGGFHIYGGFSGPPCISELPSTLGVRIVVDRAEPTERISDHVMGSANPLPVWLFDADCDGDECDFEGIELTSYSPFALPSVGDDFFDGTFVVEVEFQAPEGGPILEVGTMVSAPFELAHPLADGEL